MLNLYPLSGEIAEYLDRISRVRIAVLGDFCVDAYWILDNQDAETSIETGKPVQHVLSQRYSPGGAGNVVVNLHALGVRNILALGVIGGDVFGHELTGELKALGVDTSRLFVQGGAWDTPVYGKPVLAGVEQSRMDFGRYNLLSEATWVLLYNSLCEIRGAVDFVIVNQQLPSGWGNDARAAMVAAELIEHWPARHLVDSRQNVRQFSGAALKVNQAEAASLLGYSPDSVATSDTRAVAMAEALGSLSKEAQFITRGENGILACDAGMVDAIPGISMPGPIDPVGAGDAATAALAACRAAGLPVQQSAVIANLAAAITVQKINQTGTATPSEIQEQAARVAYIYHPALAEDQRLARYYSHSDVEIIEGICTPGCGSARFPFHWAVFDHDGTLSTLRQGWETVMEPMMLHAILGERYETVDSALFKQISRRVQQFIEVSTGIQTIAQMDALADMVAEYNLVPTEHRLDAWGYKAIYNRDLMEMVNERIRRLLSGELDAADFMMKGATSFVEALRERNVKCCLVSGTDEADANREAELLGYAHLFNGGIHGAKPGSRADSKDIVIRSLLESITAGSSADYKHSETPLLVVGDGPVEVRLGRRYGGVALGIASNEERRFGLNPIKRRRLIRAGAHLIMPDLTQWKSLIALLERA